MSDLLIWNIFISCFSSFCDLYHRCMIMENNMLWQWDNHGEEGLTPLLFSGYYSTFIPNHVVTPRDSNDVII